MPLATRIIPQLLCSGRKLIKGKQYDSWRSVGIAAQAVRVHQMRQVDELILLDITATPEGRGPNLELVREIADVCFSPLAVGGGVKSLQDIRDLLNSGADKVVIGTAAYNDKHFIHEACEKFGSSTITVSVDVRDEKVFVGCGKKDTYLNPYDYAQILGHLGVGEILLSSIDREGAMDGYDLDLVEAISELVTAPIIASGGCGTYEHMREAIDAGASAVSSGAMFQFTNNTPRGAAEYLDKLGYEVRIP